MFECAEVLNEILNAVEKGRKVLRIDHTPYRIYSLYKKKLPKTKQPIEELVEEIKQKLPIRKMKLLGKPKLLHSLQKTDSNKINKRDCKLLHIKKH